MADLISRFRRKGYAIKIIDTPSLTEIPYKNHDPSKDDLRDHLEYAKEGIITKK